jgi:hypothetical protein
LFHFDRCGVDSKEKQRVRVKVSRKKELLEIRVEITLLLGSDSFVQALSRLHLSSSNPLPSSPIRFNLKPTYHTPLALVVLASVGPFVQALRRPHPIFITPHSILPNIIPKHTQHTIIYTHHSLMTQNVSYLSSRFGLFHASAQQIVRSL